MPIKRNHRNDILVPVIGLFLFIVLYITAALIYPGGNEVDTSAKGFSWQHNYWCDLLARYAENGEINTARPIAITAMIILAGSLVFSWYYIPGLLNLKKPGKSIIRYTGILSMISLFFLFAGPDAHDTVFNIAGALGVVAMTTTLVGLFKTRLYKLLWLSITCVSLLLINNYIYYTKDYLFYLPLIQKISFLLFILWFSLLDILLYQKTKRGIQ